MSVPKCLPAHSRIKKKKIKKVIKKLTIEDCKAWMKKSNTSSSSNQTRPAKKKAHAGGNFPIGSGSTHLKVTTVVEETKEELSQVEVQEALAMLPEHSKEVTGGKPLEVAFGLTKGWSQEEAQEDDDKSNMNVGDTPLKGGKVDSRVIDFTGCVLLKRFEKEILQGMDAVQFQKPENKDGQMRISTDKPNGVKFMLGLGNGMTVYGSQSMAEYERKLLEIAKDLFTVQKTLLEEFAEERGKAAPEVELPDCLQSLAGFAKKTSYYSQDDSGSLLVDIGREEDTNGPRPFTKYDLQTLTLVLCDHPNAAEAKWTNGNKGKAIASDCQDGKDGRSLTVAGLAIVQAYGHC